jgi:hypothetical protein
MPVLPRIASYRFRLRDDDAQRAFALPEYLSHREIVTFYLRQEPSDRARYDCGHRLRVGVSNDHEMVFDLAGIADWEHEGRAHDFVPAVRAAATRVFGSPTSLKQGLFNDLDRFSIPSPTPVLSSLIEQYIRDLTPDFAVTRGAVSYLHATYSRRTRDPLTPR